MRCEGGLLERHETIGGCIGSECRTYASECIQSLVVKISSLNGFVLSVWSFEYLLSVKDSGVAEFPLAKPALIAQSYHHVMLDAPRRVVVRLCNFDCF